MKDDFPAKDARPWVPFREFMGNNPYLGFFRTNNLTVIVSRRPVCMLPNNYSHEGVQFFIALSPVRGGARDGCPVFVPGGFIYPVNGSQTHAVTEPILRVSFISLYFRHPFFRKMCRVLRGSSDTQFENGLIPYDAELRGLMRAFFVEYGAGRRGNPNIGADVMLESLVTQLAVCLIRRLRFTAAATEGEPRDETGMERVVEHLNENPTPLLPLGDLRARPHEPVHRPAQVPRAHGDNTPPVPDGGPHPQGDGHPEGPPLPDRRGRRALRLRQPQPLRARIQEKNGILPDGVPQAVPGRGTARRQRSGTESQ